MLKLSTADKNMMDDLSSLKGSLVWKMVDNRPTAFTVRGVIAYLKVNSLESEYVIIEKCDLVVDNPDYVGEPDDDRYMGFPSIHSIKHLYFDCLIGVKFYKSKQDLLNSFL